MKERKLNELQRNFDVVLAAYPLIAKKIKLFWGHQEFTALLDDLLTNTRGHERAGFPKEVSIALWELKQRHDHVFPKLAEHKGIEWQLNYRA